MIRSLSRLQKCLWAASVFLVTLVFFLFDGVEYLRLAAALVGVTSLIFCAAGNPVWQALMVLFSLLYGIISFRFRYYGEMLTYLGMTLPMACVSFVEWIRPSAGSGCRRAFSRGVVAFRSAFTCGDGAVFLPAPCAEDGESHRLHRERDDELSCGVSDASFRAFWSRAFCRTDSSP